MSTVACICNRRSRDAVARRRQQGCRLTGGRYKYGFCICEHLTVDPAQVSLDSSFVDDLGADSLDIVQLIMGLEEEYQVEISDEDAEKIRTVQDVIDYVQAEQK